MTADFFIIFFVARYLRSTVKNTEYFEVWNKRLTWAMYGSIAMIVVQATVHSAHTITMVVGGAALLARLYFIY